MIIVSVVMYDPHAGRLLQREKALPSVQHQPLLVVRPVPGPRDVILARRLVPVLQFERLAVSVNPIQLWRLLRDGADEAERLFANGILDVEAGEGVAVVECAMRGIGIVKVELKLIPSKFRVHRKRYWARTLCFRNTTIFPSTARESEQLTRRLNFASRGSSLGSAPPPCGAAC